jgi:anti-sigma factor (TIGR02949 family)
MAILEISCVEVWREISNYIDHDISPDLRARMEQHFKACDHCRAVIDGAQNVVKIVADDRAFDIPQEVGKRLFAKFEKEILKK